MSKRDREEAMRKKLSSHTVLRVVSTADDIENPDAPPVTSLADFPRGEWYVIGKSGRREEWSEQGKPAIDMFNSQAQEVQCAICRKPQAGQSALAAVRLSEDGEKATMQAICLDCVCARSPQELRDALGS